MSIPTMGLILFDVGPLQPSMASRTDLYVNRINILVAKTTDRKALIADLASKLVPSKADFALAV